MFCRVSEPIDGEWDDEWDEGWDDEDEDEDEDEDDLHLYCPPDFYP